MPKKDNVIKYEDISQEEIDQILEREFGNTKVKKEKKQKQKNIKNKNISQINIEQETQQEFNKIKVKKQKPIKKWKLIRIKLSTLFLSIAGFFILVAFIIKMSNQFWELDEVSFFNKNFLTPFENDSWSIAVNIKKLVIDADSGKLIIIDGNSWIANGENVSLVAFIINIIANAILIFIVPIFLGLGILFLILRTKQKVK